MEERGQFPENAAAREISINGHGEGTAAVSAPITESDREPYLRLLLEEFEGGKLDAYEYAQRVQAVGRAGSLAELGALVQVASPGEATGVAEAPRPVYDAVDLALLKASSTSSGGKDSRRRNNRYAALIVIVVVFVVLLAVGIWLATHVHGASNNSGALAVHAGLFIFGSAI